jgi:hypothetical protein
MLLGQVTAALVTNVVAFLAPHPTFLKVRVSLVYLAVPLRAQAVCHAGNSANVHLACYWLKVVGVNAPLDSAQVV